LEEEEDVILVQSINFTKNYLLMNKCFLFLAFVLSLISAGLVGKAQIHSVYDQLVYVNAEWKNQTDVDPQLRSELSQALDEQKLIQLHLHEVEKLLRERDISKLTPQLKENRLKNLNVLHQYCMAGVFPVNSRHMNRQPYFIDDNNVYCAVGYLMKESGADDVAKDIRRTQNYSFLADIHHDKLMSWVQQSGLTFDELALIQPAYGEDWPAAIIEFHYNNAGPDVNEYIEIHQSSGQLIGMIPFNKVLFYDGTGTLYKTLLIAQMQTFTSGVHQFYHYLFPVNENFADNGRVELWGTNPSLGTNKLIAVNTYTNNSLQLDDYFYGNPWSRVFNIGESESTLVNFSLNFCDFYRNITYNLQSMPTTIGALNACLILPISLSNFSYSIIDKKVNLHWETTSETNSRQFIVERSLNGMDFQAIGSVPASGNSSSLKQYSLTDNAPNYINHYRIKQVDVDGRFTYSKILYVKVEKASPLHILQNVVSTNLQYHVNAEMAGSKLDIYDMTGRNVYSTVTKAGAQQLNVSGWSVGKYLIRLIAVSGQTYSHQFIKQ
jgi:hypothetical protein